MEPYREEIYFLVRQFTCYMNRLSLSIGSIVIYLDVWDFLFWSAPILWEISPIRIKEKSIQKCKHSWLLQLSPSYSRLRRDPHTCKETTTRPTFSGHSYRWIIWWKWVTACIPFLNSATIVTIFFNVYKGLFDNVYVLLTVLASWFRLKYPHVALGALASSAPILYFDDIVPPEKGYYSIVTQDFRVSISIIRY